MVSQTIPREKRLVAVFKDMARAAVPGIVTWALAAITGTIAAVSSHSQTGVLPLTTLTYFVIAAAGGAVCFLLAGLYIWDPVRRFTVTPKPFEGRAPRAALVTELDSVESQTREKIRDITRQLDQRSIQEEEWFKQAEVLFSAISVSRALRKGYPTMVKAARRATWAVALVGLSVLVVGIYIASLPQDSIVAALVGMFTVVVVFMGVSIGFYNANLVPPRWRWGSDVSTLCDSTSYDDMKDTITTWAEDIVRSRKIVSG